MPNVNFNPEILEEFFNIKVREACKSCKRYGKKATCPPNLDSFDYYRKLLPSYENGILVIKQYQVDNPLNWKELGKSSSLDIHNELYDLRTKILETGHFPIIFGAGSCKFCSDECVIPCKFPEKAAVPLEATGLDVVALVSIITNVHIKFPVTDIFYRVGLILWD